jgi:cobalt/nickel transport system permease protein
VHIPDGYLSPVFALGTGMVTVPAWVIGARRVQRILNNRTVPLLAVFSAFAFTVMLFNIPVPGGTTAHGVAGTLMAIVLGPWAAVIGVSVALIIQALFFGDGGVLAIPANCLNMGVILPFVGYGVYVLIAGRSPLLSMRRVWASGIGAYAGITAAAVAVGVELGLQPILFSSNGQPLYSPYTIAQAVPAMLLSHAFGASLVEALITALGVAYLQRRHPEFLRLRRAATGAGEDVRRGSVAPRPLVALVAAAGVVVLAGIGLITGGGSPARAFGADWSLVSWPDVAVMLVVVAVLAAVLIPLAHRFLPRPVRGIGTFFVALAVIAPIGLIAPGFAYGEGSTEDVQQAFGYVPHGLQQLSGVFSAPLGGYNIPIGFFSGENAPLWHQAIGYELAGLAGILLLGAVVVGGGYLLSRLGGPSRHEREPATT